MTDDNHKPILIVIAGPNGSGKTTITSKILKHQWTTGAEYINPDIIAKDVFGDWNSPDAIKKSVEYCAEIREKCLFEKKSLIFETVLSAKEKVDFIKRAKDAGYFIRIFFVCTASPTINASRIAARVMHGGHDVPIEKIISRYQKSIANCAEIIKIVDRCYIYDNSIENEEATLLLRTVDGKIEKQYKFELPEWCLPIIYCIEEKILSLPRIIKR